MPSHPLSLTRREALALFAAPLTIRDHRWTINGRLTYPGAPAEGLLLNVRMVNAVFEDTRRPDIDPAANTARFLAALPDYLDCGIRAFTLSLQGGDPGYEGALNSALLPDGSLKPSYMARVARVIDACDRAGAAVILSIFYQRQDQVLRDERAVRAAVRNVARWARRRPNLLLEIANEFPHRGYDHAILRSPAGQAELIALARENAPRLLISTSGVGDGRVPREVAVACDYLTPHLNNTPVEQIPARLADLRQYGKPIVVNEDDKTGAAGIRSARACIAAGVSWGYMASQVNQRYPFRFDGANDDPPVYAFLKHVTTADDYFPPPDSQGGWRTRLDARFDPVFDDVRRSTRNGGLLIVRDGWLVYERYFGLGHRDATPNLASIGKSYTSVACGVLLADRLDAKVFTPEFLPDEAFPLADPRLADVRLGHLLAMTAGIRGNNPVYVHGKPQTIDPPGPDGAAACVDRVALRPSIWCEPGAGYSYATSSAHLASIVVRHVSGVELQQFVGENLARPLGWGEWGWGYRNTPAAVHTPGGGGICVRATDMLRFGWLLANDGRWADQQVIPRDYVRHCCHRSPYNPHSPYSLQFDVADDGTDAFWKLGSGGHALGVVPSKRLVVWKLGGRDGQYSPADTGLEPSPGTGAPSTPDPDLDPATAWRRTLTAVLRLCAMLLLIVRFAAAAVDTAIGDDYFDGRDPVSRIERHLKTARKLGVQHLRCAFSWNGIEPEQGRYDFRFWDELVARAAKHGIDLIPYVAYTPKWAARTEQDFYRQPPRDPQFYADFLYALVSRYRGRVRSWEIWNEPDNKDYWTGSAEEFADFVVPAARRIREADPNARIILGGMANGPSPFFRAIIETHHVDRLVDVVALHAYPESWLNERAETIFDEWVPAMRKLVDPRVPLWLNEMGYADYRYKPGEASIYGVRAFYRYEHTPAYQAAMLFKMHVMALATGQLSLTGWYRIDDFPPADTRIGTDLVNHHLGVVDPNHYAKPAFRSLRFFTRHVGRVARLARRLSIGAAEVRTFTTDRRKGWVVAWLRSSRPEEIADRSGMLEDTRTETIAIDPPCKPKGKLKTYDPEGRRTRPQPLAAVRLTGPDIFIAEFSCAN
jgi:CubicO group peptidase (beta-lactamase class C family)